MARIHLNWSGCRDWNSARAKLTEFNTTLYGNFADLTGDATVVKSRLEALGFEVKSQLPARDQDVCYVLYGVNSPIAFDFEAGAKFLAQGRPTFLSFFEQLKGVLGTAEDDVTTILQLVRDAHTAEQKLAKVQRRLDAGEDLTQASRDVFVV